MAGLTRGVGPSAFSVALLALGLGSVFLLRCDPGPEPPGQDFLEEDSVELLPTATQALPAATASDQTLDSIRSRYPRGWDVQIPQGTRLEEVSRAMDLRLDLLPAADLDDRAPLPPWFRVYLRLTYPGLPTEGPLQYPRYSTIELRWAVENPDSVDFPGPREEG